MIVACLKLAASLLALKKTLQTLSKDLQLAWAVKNVELCSNFLDIRYSFLHCRTLKKIFYVI